MIASSSACIWGICAWFAKWLPALWDLGNSGTADSDLCKTDDLKWMMVIFLDVNIPTLCTNDGDLNHVIRCEFAWSGHLHACKWPFLIFVEILSWHGYMWCWLHDGASGVCAEVLDEQGDAFLKLQICFRPISLIRRMCFENLMMIFLDVNAPILYIIDGEPDHVTKCAFAWSGHLHACKWPFGIFVENLPWLV